MQDQAQYIEGVASSSDKMDCESNDYIDGIEKHEETEIIGAADDIVNEVIANLNEVVIDANSADVADDVECIVLEEAVSNSDTDRDCNSDSAKDNQFQNEVSIHSNIQLFEEHKCK